MPVTLTVYLATENGVPEDASSTTRRFTFPDNPTAEECVDEVFRTAKRLSQKAAKPNLANEG